MFHVILESMDEDMVTSSVSPLSTFVSPSIHFSHINATHDDGYVMGDTYMEQTMAILLKLKKMLMGSHATLKVSC